MNSCKDTHLSCYRIIDDPEEIAAAREKLINGPQWFVEQARANDWHWDADKGRVICVEMSAL